MQQLPCKMVNIYLGSTIQCNAIVTAALTRCQPENQPFYLEIDNLNTMYNYVNGGYGTISIQHSSIIIIGGSIVLISDQIPITWKSVVYASFNVSVLDICF